MTARPQRPLDRRFTGEHIFTESYAWKRGYDAYVPGLPSPEVYQLSPYPGSDPMYRWWLDGFHLAREENVARFNAAKAKAKKGGR